jgi:antitoxin VapB
MERITEVQTKHNRIRKYLGQEKLDGVLLTSVANFSWITAGGDSHVENSSKFGVASILVTEKEKFILTNNIEVNRLLKEQLTGIEAEFEFIVSKWFDPAEEESLIQNLVSGKKITSETYRSSLPLLNSNFQSLRYQLTESEVERYQWLGKQTASAIELVAKKIAPGMTEHEIEAEMSKALTYENILPTVLLVAGDDRNFSYRHPVPTENKFTHFAKMVCCARKWGLVAALTRSVYAGKIPDELLEKHEKACFVDSVFISHTVPGTRISKIFEQGMKAYDQVGFPGEWENHHQGGGIGYDSREFVATPLTNDIVVGSQAFAWNPSIHGNKSEDTMIVNAHGQEIITMTKEWPMIDVKTGTKTYQRPAILQI